MDARSMVQRLPREVVLELTADEEWIQLYIKALKDGLARRKRSAMRDYAEMHKLVGQQQGLAVLVIQQLGAKDEREARNAVETYQRAQQLSKRELARECVRLLVELVGEDGSLASETEPLKALSSAAVEET